MKCDDRVESWSNIDGADSSRINKVEPRVYSSLQFLGVFLIKNLISYAYSDKESGGILWIN